MASQLHPLGAPPALPLTIPPPHASSTLPVPHSSPCPQYLHQMPAYNSILVWKDDKDPMGVRIPGT